MTAVGILFISLPAPCPSPSLAQLLRLALSSWLVSFRSNHSPMKYIQ